LFEDDNNVVQPGFSDRMPRQAHEAGPGVIRTEAEEKLAEEEARRKREEEDRLKREEQERKEEEERQKREEAERIRKENSPWHKFKKMLGKLGEDIVSEE
jgi:membrane protein involved in colicin uptake